MFLRFLLPGHYRVTVTVAKTTEVIGVNSNVKETKHILLWDFDSVELERVQCILSDIVHRYALGNIHIFQTRKTPASFHAFCLCAQEWTTVVEILASTPGLDWSFFKWGVVRGHFTLRIGPKGDSIPYKVGLIEGYRPDDVEWTDLKSFTKYETRLNKYAD